MAWLSLVFLVLAGSLRGQETAERRPVILRVLLPQANATLSIEDKPTRQTGIVRVFESPALEPGKTFTYTLKTTWEPNNYTTITRTRTVEVRSGQTVEVDLRQADPKEPDKIVVVYIPTPQVVVEAMLKLAGVGKGDVVYDLGCGDGRIVVTAVAKYGAQRGVGVDIDPERIKDSKANARQHKVEDKVEFRQADILEMKDLGDATVVMLYLGDDLNLRLRPLLQKALKPGSRIVSHRFLLGDWKPDRTEVVTDRKGTPYELHLWTIGAGNK
jgi:uncharacterized protein (TIGR03000 family)